MKKINDLLQMMSWKGSLMIRQPVITSCWLAIAGQFMLLALVLIEPTFSRLRKMAAVSWFVWPGCLHHVCTVVSCDGSCELVCLIRLSASCLYYCDLLWQW